MMEKFNAKIALVITEAVGSMWCAYAFTVLALISFPAAIHGGIAPLVAWIAQTFLQLVLLSVIMGGQEVSNKKSEKRATLDHQMIKQDFAEIKDMQRDNDKIMAQLESVLFLCNALVNAMYAEKKHPHNRRVSDGDRRSE